MEAEGEEEEVEDGIEDEEERARRPSLDPDPSASTTRIRLIPSSPTLNNVRSAPSPIYAIASGKEEPGVSGMEGIHKGMAGLDLGNAVLTPDEAELVKEKKEQKHHDIEVPLDNGSVLELDRSEAVGEISAEDSEDHQRHIIVNLSSDRAFFELLLHALTSLDKLHEEQQQLFKASVDRLCKLISSSITPSNKPSAHIKALIPHRKLKGVERPSDLPDPTDYRESDLYAWREIFTLWIEAQIFESGAERDRGERTLDQAEKRLKAFAAEVVKRGLGDRRTLRRPESREAWAEFLRLNVLMLDLKRFQLANINAARK